jgi:thiamine biosynthesis lipoprotein
MKRKKILMGMTIKIEIADKNVNKKIFFQIFSYFETVDKKFSTYKKGSEISKINRGEITEQYYSEEMKEVFRLAEETKKETNGYFDIKTPEKMIDPSGIVKGWAINKAGRILKKEGYKNFYIDVGGDIEVVGKNINNEPWKIGIRNPLKIEEIVKVLSIKNKGVATSGTYERGEHIYNPKEEKQSDAQKNCKILSLTVIGPNIYEADRFATAAFAMGKNGISFIENLPGFEGYMINENGTATLTTGLGEYVV